MQKKKFTIDLGKHELNEEEQALTKRYQLDDAVLIAVVQPNLLRQGILAGFVGFIPAAFIFPAMLGAVLGALLSLAAAFGAGYWWINEKRETIFVRDLIHGRNFKCDSVVDLARKEAWLTTAVSFLTGHGERETLGRHGAAPDRTAPEG